MPVPYWEWQLSWIKDNCASQVQKELTWCTAILPQATKCTSSLTASSLEQPVLIPKYTGGTDVVGGGRQVITFRVPKHINTLSAKLTIFQTCLPQCFLINCLVQKKKKILENVLNNYSCTFFVSVWKTSIISHCANVLWVTVELRMKQMTDNIVMNFSCEGFWGNNFSHCPFRSQFKSGFSQCGFP